MTWTTEHQTLHCISFEAVQICKQKGRQAKQLRRKIKQREKSMSSSGIFGSEIVAINGSKEGEELTHFESDAGENLMRRYREIQSYHRKNT